MGTYMITGVNCSCVEDGWKQYFCLKHYKEIFGLDRPDYEKYKTDADREP
jgi:hypothetical protein